MSNITTIGVLTSDGGAPGMNAAICAVTRAGICNGFKVKGIYKGFDGLINNEIKDLTTESVNGIIMSGGTILKTARSLEFMTPEGRRKAYENVKKHEMGVLIMVGGNGPLRGAMELGKEYDIRYIGLPGTVDSDLYGANSAVGYDTTLNTIVKYVDRVRDTAQSHERISFVEVVEHNAGFSTQNSTITSGAEATIIPEDRTGMDQLGHFMERGIRKSKCSCVVIVSESPKRGALYYADRVRKEFPGYDIRVTILEHLQHEGRPSAHDKTLAGRTGVSTIEAIVQGQHNIIIDIKNNEIDYIPLVGATRNDKPFDRKLIKVLDELSI